MCPSLVVHRVTSYKPRTLFVQLAAIHRAEIKHGFLARMGERFLVRLYMGLALSPHSFLFVAMEDDEVQGFICGSLDTSKVYKRFLLRWGLVVWPLLLPRLLSLHAMKKVFETLIYPSKRELDTLPKAEILNFCVSSAHQRKGIGRQLFSSLVLTFRQLGISRIRIVTGENQESARHFYESLGATKASEIHVHHGTSSFVYTLDLDCLDIART